jgi:hypothetical protein
MSDLMREINNMAWDPQSMADEITNEHRTLQQSAGNGILLAIKTWAEDYEAGHYDLRNEDICRKSAIMLKALEDAGEPLACRFI